MAWILPLVSIASDLLGKQQEADTARRVNLEKTQQGILNQKAAASGGNPYSAQLGNYVLGSDQLEEALNNRGSDLGKTLQALKGVTGSDKKIGGGSGAIGGASFQLTKPSLLDDEPDPYALDSSKYSLTRDPSDYSLDPRKYRL